MSIDLANARATLHWQGVSLGVVALVASAALVFANALTQGPIAEAASSGYCTSAPNTSGSSSAI